MKVDEELARPINVIHTAYQITIQFSDSPPACFLRLYISYDEKNACYNLLKLVSEKS